MQRSQDSAIETEDVQSSSDIGEASTAFSRCNLSTASQCKRRTEQSLMSKESDYSTSKFRGPTTLPPSIEHQLSPYLSYLY